MKTRNILIDGAIAIGGAALAFALKTIFDVKDEQKALETEQEDNVVEVEFKPED